MYSDPLHLEGDEAEVVAQRGPPPDTLSTPYFRPPSDPLYLEGDGAEVVVQHVRALQARCGHKRQRKRAVRHQHLEIRQRRPPVRLPLLFGPLLGQLAVGPFARGRPSHGGSVATGEEQHGRSHSDAREEHAPHDNPHPCARARVARVSVAVQ
eukprot:1196104-Prorocentrum_minimum.AAC.10